MARFFLDDLRVYAMSETLADAIWELVASCDSFAKTTVGRQLVRAADSVGANIAEGFGRASPADHQRFVRTARGSLDEVKHFLRGADKRSLVPREDKRRLQKLLTELLPALNAYLTSLKPHKSVAD